MKIPEPKKLPSGSWHIQLRLGGESISITESSAKRCKQQAQLIKAEYLAGKRQPAQKSDMTLGEILDAYIAKYETVLSPTTIRGYASIRKNRFPAYMDSRISAIKDWQAMINEELLTKSEHTVSNGWGAVTAALRDLALPVPTVKLAKIPVKEMPFLEPEEIPLFLAAVEGDPCEIEILLELHSLRESEALQVVRTQSWDLKHNTIIVSGALVRSKGEQLVEKKTNKSKGSTRTIPIMIPRLAELLLQLQASGETVPLNSPTTILRHVHSSCALAGVTDVTNHGLRHTFASLGYSLGLSERMIMEYGGWDDPTTMHKIYIRLAQRDKEKAMNAMSAFYAPKDRLQQALEELHAIIEKYNDVDLATIEKAVEELKNANENANDSQKTA